MPSVLMATGDGVYLVTAGDEPQLLVQGRTAVAIADGQGGVFYQIDRGRSYVSTGSAARTTTIWWVPSEGTTPIDILVPSSGHDLTLNDVVVIDGRPVVYYTRSEGSRAFETFDSLRRYDVGTRTVTELMKMSSWEMGYGSVTVGEQLISATEYGQVDSSCLFLDLEGRQVNVVGDPTRPGCESPDCPRLCTLDRSASRLAYVDEELDPSTGRIVGWTITVVDTVVGNRIGVVDLPGDEAVALDSLDFAGDWLLVNRHSYDVSPTGTVDALTPLIVAADGRGSAPVEVPLEGFGRFVTVAPHVAATIAPRDDGLGLVSFGRPMVAAMALLESALGPPDDEGGFFDSQAEGYDCFAATGYACRTLFRWLAWDTGLSVVFTDGDIFRDDGVAHLVYWGVTSPDVLQLAGGVGVGSTVAEVVAIYGDRVMLGHDECADIATLWIGPEPGIHAYLDGTTEDPTSTISYLWAGNAGSC